MISTKLYLRKTKEKDVAKHQNVLDDFSWKCGYYSRETTTEFICDLHVRTYTV